MHCLHKDLFRWKAEIHLLETAEVAEILPAMTIIRRSVLRHLGVGMKMAWPCSFGCIITCDALKQTVCTEDTEAKLDKIEANDHRPVDSAALSLN